ncbi:uncharacterized protein EMH_0059000 [Eimeria mitis]|uniref:Uncharacterized protein n=1 Tax=Eimeria mitis TaxID=44415 RepID=U6K436_9EIME|nr:uncharacterized protein EMH_0059000 [Eimeria mitis]CDJ30518.1 hypothetical protein, conserved [Eimeria mitis]
MVSHALRHHQERVCGILVGPGDSSVVKNQEVICTEAVPLLHTHMLHPQLRLGVELVETLCEGGVTEESGEFFAAFRENKWTKPKIVGIYYADVLTTADKTPTMNKEASHIARVLRQHYPQLVVCLLDFRRMPESKPVTTFWSFGATNWTAVPTEAIHVSDAAQELAAKTVQEHT